MNTNQNFGSTDLGIVQVVSASFPVRSVFFRDTSSGDIEVCTREDALFPEVSEMEFLCYTTEGFHSLVAANPRAIYIKLDYDKSAGVCTTSQEALYNAFSRPSEHAFARPKPEVDFSAGYVRGDWGDIYPIDARIPAKGIITKNVLVITDDFVVCKVSSGGQNYLLMLDELNKIGSIG